MSDRDGIVYYSETQKIRQKVLMYCDGLVLDIGCGGDKIKPDAIGIDVRELPGVNLKTERLNKISEDFPEYVNGCDAVYSSHCLEHFKDDVGAVKDWIKLIKVGGYLVLYLPDMSLYKEYNPEHLHSYYHINFVSFFMKNFPGLKVEDHGIDEGYNRYSFYVVARRTV